MTPALTRAAADGIARVRPVEVRPTTAAGDAERLAREGIARGVALVVALGGDGTVAEVAAAAAGTDAVLAPLPGGSTSVFSRAVGWPRDVPAAVAALERALRAHTPPRDVRIGVVRAGDADRIACCNAGVGPDAEAVAMVEAHPASKRRLGQVAFAGAVVAAVARETVRHVDIEVSVDDAGAIAAAGLSVAWVRPYTFLGRWSLDLVPGGGPEDGMAWLALRRRGPLGVAEALAGALAGGRHAGHERFASGVGAARVVVRSARPLAVQADGEALGFHHEVEFRPGPVLRVLAPAPGAAVR